MEEVALNRLTRLPRNRNVALGGKEIRLPRNLAFGKEMV